MNKLINQIDKYKHINYRIDISDENCVVIELIDTIFNTMTFWANDGYLKVDSAFKYDFISLSKSHQVLVTKHLERKIGMKISNII